MKIFSIIDQPTKLKLISNKIIFNLLFSFFVNHSSFLKFVQNKKKMFFSQQTINSKYCIAFRNVKHINGKYIYLLYWLCLAIYLI